MPVHQGDRSILVALYESTNGPNWRNNANWLADKLLNAWHGVTTDGDGRVIELWLNSNQLSGEIPPELGGLSKLRLLSVSGNELIGEIPPELGDLASIEGLVSRQQPVERGNTSTARRPVQPDQLWPSTTTS